MSKLTHVKRILSVVAFLLVFVLVYRQVSWVLQEKVDKCDRLHSFFQQPANSLDVVFVGSSHIHYSVYPNQLWHDYGFTSYDASSPAQAIPVSYYLIKETVEKKHPQIIVLDTYYMVYDVYARNQEHIHELTDSMGLFSGNRFAAINDLVPNTEGDETVWSYYFNIALYHSRWSELTSLDFAPIRGFLKGALIFGSNEKVEIYEPVEEKLAVPDTAMEYLNRIRQVCEENDTELLLISIPYQRFPEVFMALEEMDWDLIAMKEDEESKAELARRIAKWQEMSPDMPLKK